MKKKLNVEKGVWAKELPRILWALKTSIHSGTQKTLFNLAFGIDVVIPRKIGTNTLRTTYYETTSK